MHLMGFAKLSAASLILGAIVITPAVGQRERGTSNIEATERANDPQPKAKRLTPAERAAIAQEYRERRRRAIGGGTRVPLQQGPGTRESQAGVCRSQCALERSSCDSRGSGSFRERADQLQAAQSSCFLAVQSCMARCR